MGGFGGGVGFGDFDECAGVGCAVGVACVEGAVVGVALPAAFLCACLLVLVGDGVAVARAAASACDPGPGPDDGVLSCAVVVATAWLNRFMKPTTPTALNRVARHVRVDSLRRPSSRCALSRWRCLMGVNETGKYVKRPSRTVQARIVSGWPLAAASGAAS